jgi:hypothetical protein
MLEYQVEYYDNGNKRIEKWLKDGKLHREDGYAFIQYERAGAKNKVLFYIYGQKINIPRYRIIDALKKIPREAIIVPNIVIMAEQLSNNLYIKILYMFRRAITKYKIKKRKQLFEVLKETELNITNGPDICNLLTTFIY